MTNDDLERVMRSLVGDEPPAELFVVADAIYSFRALDRGELAELVDDRVGSVGVRSGDDRVLTFETDALTIEVTMSPRHLVGQVMPAGRFDIVLESIEGESDATTTDEYGIFTLPRWPRPMRLVCTPTNGSQGPATRTTWWRG